jgi:hypothetical protein
MMILFLSGLAVVVGVSAASAATTPKPSTTAKYQACLKAHGVTFGTGKQPSAAKTKAAFKACASLAPKGSAGGFANRPARNSAAFKKFTACMSKHGIKFTGTSRPQRTSAKFQAARKACGSLLPKRPANG